MSVSPNNTHKMPRTNQGRNKYFGNTKKKDKTSQPIELTFESNPKENSYRLNDLRVKSTCIKKLCGQSKAHRLYSTEIVPAYNNATSKEAFLKDLPDLVKQIQKDFQLSPSQTVRLINKINNRMRLYLEIKTDDTSKDNLIVDLQRDKAEKKRDAKKQNRVSFAGVVITAASFMTAAPVLIPSSIIFSNISDRNTKRAGRINDILKNLGVKDEWSCQGPTAEGIGLGLGFN